MILLSLTTKVEKKMKKAMSKPCNAWVGDKSIAIFVLEGDEKPLLGNQIHNVTRRSNWKGIYYESDRFGITWKNMKEVKAHALKWSEDNA